MPHAKRTASGVLGGLLGLVGLSAVAGVLVTATVTPAIAVSGYAASSAITMFDSLPGYLEVDRPMLPTTIYAKDPNTGGHIELTSFYDQNREPVEYDQVAPVMYDAILSSEDPRYYEHGGIDLMGTTRALLSNMQGNPTQGGSSISQQYVKNVLIQRCEKEAPTPEELQACWYEATESQGAEGYERKLQEMRYAISIEQEYSKEEILLGYLNIANFGGTTYGIEAAARYYFGVSSSDLDIGQAAVLAGIVQNPNQFRIDQPDREDNGAANGYAKTKQRQSYVLSRMLADGKITQEQHDQAVEAPIEPNINPRESGCVAAGGSAYFCQYVKNTILTDPAFGETAEARQETLSRGGLDIYTTLDLNVQMPAEQAMQDAAPTWYEGIDFGASGVSIEASTGRILALTQNTMFSEDADLVQSHPGYSSLVYAADYAHGRSGGFPPGSSYKLFTLIDWLEKGHSVRETLNATNRQFNMTCDGAPVYSGGTEDIGNYGGTNGYTADVREFTRQSLNTGYLAMAERLNLCDINRVAERMGLTYGDGSSVTKENVPFDVLGSKNIPPIQMAGAYATVANNGVYCEPKAIDRVVGADGQEMTPPKTECKQVIAPEIAATAAYALSGVMYGGTGQPSNPGDGVPVIGKTGTHNQYQTSMLESSTNVTTGVWVGNTTGEGDLYGRYYNNRELSQIRHAIAPVMQHAANLAYGGNAFPEPDSNLTRQVLRDLPSVIGMSIDEATSTLEGAGFSVNVGEPEPGTQGEGLVTRQDPGSGQVAAGTIVTIFPSNGRGMEVPDVSGQRPRDATVALISAGFNNAVLGECSRNTDAAGGRVTSTDPSAGTVTSPGTTVRINYEAASCGGLGNNDDD